MKHLATLKPTYIIYFIDSDPDTGMSLTMTPIAYAETEPIAKAIEELFNKENAEPNRKYYNIHL